MTLSSIDWPKVGERLGIPTMFMLMTMLFMGYAMHWSAENIALPMMHRHMEFMSATETVMRTQTETLQKNTVALEQMARSLEMRAGHGVNGGD